MEKKYCYRTLLDSELSVQGFSLSGFMVCGFGGCVIGKWFDIGKIMDLYFFALQTGISTEFEYVSNILLFYVQLFVELVLLFFYI